MTLLAPDGRAMVGGGFTSARIDSPASDLQR